jgi:hypothetical protein
MKVYDYYKDDGEFWFEWNDGESRHVTKCSFHGCIMLGREFEKFGYREGGRIKHAQLNELDVNENSAGEGMHEMAGQHGYFSDRWYNQK